MKELLELDGTATVLINFIQNALNICPAVAQAKGDQRFFKFFNTNRSYYISYLIK